MLDARNIKIKRPTRMLVPKSYGPFPVTRVGTKICTLDLGAGWNIFPLFHILLIETYRKSVRISQKQDRPPPHPNDIEGESEHEVEALIWSEKRVSGRGARQSARMFYLVKWWGYRKDECCWELVEVMERLVELVEEFHMAYPDMSKP